ncbi:MAG TPA: hypothetical protein PLW93_00005 [Candidatus Absconditabacterales bacterium]|nr:hypothetical protein [Candidatus Absconditabacterales bacterium]HNG96635.1 hypothetical protein [Candidatus Absconditabacterales bacterium]
MEDPKLIKLLRTVVETYVEKGEPVGSKFLHTLENNEYAPSTLRKYLNILEKEGLVYQSYNSSGRIPTVQGLSSYLQELIDTTSGSTSEVDVELQESRLSLKYVVEQLGAVVDGVTVGFIERDEYYYIGINKLLKQELNPDEYEVTRQIIQIIEDKQIVSFLGGKILKNNQIYYSFIGDDQKCISCLFARIMINNYPSILAIIGGVRVDYERNCMIMNNVLGKLG